VSPATATWEALGSTATVVVTDGAALVDARRAVEHELVSIDRACSRFREDSELARVHAADGRPVAVGPLLLEAVRVALRAARQTDGIVDPTVGAALIAGGYDRDFRDIPSDARWRPRGAAPGWETVRLDRDRGVIQLRAGARLDLGATAKALAADRAAAAAATSIAPHGVLVSLGGDIAIGGSVPAGGWAVGIADGHRQAHVDTTVAVAGGGLATSSTTQRRWRSDGIERHHIFDPRTGLPAAVVWRTASVVAASCVEANTASTAAIVLGAAAPSWLEAQGLASRLVRRDGAVLGVGGWRVEEAVA
jgi:thiamine biosynthesis lipoprotein